MLLREVNKTPPFMDPSGRPSSSRSPCLRLIANIHIAANRGHSSVVAVQLAAAHLAVNSEAAAMRKAELRVKTPRLIECLDCS